ncbi:hypothetical protein MC885_013224 [Smutsia gigantea]|nr:hypothetical protein MC885_013224 [Smutsia gigantea]
MRTSWASAPTEDRAAKPGGFKQVPEEGEARDWSGRVGGGGWHAGLSTLPLGLQGPALDRAWRAAPASRGPGRGPRPGGGGSPGLGAADGAERSAAGGGVGEGAGQGKCDVSAEPFYTSFPGLRQSRCRRRRRPRVLASLPPGAGLRVPARRAPPPPASMSGVKKQKTRLHIALLIPPPRDSVFHLSHPLVNEPAHH